MNNITLKGQIAKYTPAGEKVAKFKTKQSILMVKIDNESVSILKETGYDAQPFNDAYYVKIRVLDNSKIEGELTNEYEGTFEIVYKSLRELALKSAVLTRIYDF